MATGPGMRAAAARGFVLVGVVMMVIALTIIGLSLYSLSGYETQFYGQSLFDRQALYSASGGVELVKELVLSDQGSPAMPRLSSAGLAVGREGVVSALAWQDSPADSSGPIDFGQPVHIRVGVVVHGVERTVEGQFSATEAKSPYRYLLTVPGQVIAVAPPGSQCDEPIVGYPFGRARVVMSGNAWQNIPPADSAWKSPSCFAVNLVAPFMITPDRAPSTDASGFVSAHIGGATLPTMVLGTGGTPVNMLDLDGSYSGRFFRSPTSDPGAPQALRNGFDFVSENPLRIRVRGTAIWVVQRGLHLSNGLRVERLPNTESQPNLVIVAGPSGRYPGSQTVGLDILRGINIDSGPNSDVNVFLVTDGDLVDSEENNGTSDLNYAGRLCMFAQNYLLLPGGLLSATSPNHAERRYGGPSMLTAADDLLRRGLLPAPVGGAAEGLALVPGSWTTSPGLP